MIPAEYYQDIFLIVVAIFSVNLYLKSERAGLPLREQPSEVLWLAIGMSLYFGLRPVHAVFADMVGYAQYYTYNLGSPFGFDFDVENLLYDNLLLYMASVGIPLPMFFLLIAAVYFLVRYVAVKKIFPQNAWTAYLVFLGAFITFASAVNGIKAGAATSLFVCAIAYRDRKWLALMLLALSWGLHHAFSTCVLAFLLVYFYKNTKVYSAIWIIGFLLAALHVTFFQNFFAEYTDDKSAGYLIGSDTGFYTGMRYDFVLYSAMPVFIGWYQIFKRHFEDETYTFIFNLYLLLNGLWMSVMYASFTNRIAGLSWGFYHLVLIYPFLSEKFVSPKKSRFIGLAVVLHLSFTLFMHFVYY